MSASDGSTLDTLARNIQIVECEIVALAAALKAVELQRNLQKDALATERLVMLLEALDGLRDRYSSELTAVRP